jgi:hypothetical protein
MDLTVEELIEKMHSLEFTEIGKKDDVPFNASVRGYSGATDSDGCSWLVKPIPGGEVLEHKLQEIAYYLDFCLATPAAPNIVVTVDGARYRATKIVLHAMQISSFNYLDEPFKRALAKDLINRWLFFDEDRNPNNYLVLHDSNQRPVVVVIDYNKADLKSEGMKITGRDDSFGWNRLEKTRFLTLLKPSNFENLSIEDFEDRLASLRGVTPERIKRITVQAFRGESVEGCTPEDAAELVARNIAVRADYIDRYFRKWFSERDQAKEDAETDRYAGLGKSFLEYYRNRR